MDRITDQDLQVIAKQLGRMPQGVLGVVSRCAGGFPQVIVNAPVRLQAEARAGIPQIFPTLYWLTCPRLVAAVSQLEAEGWVAQVQMRVDSDPELTKRLEAAHARTARERMKLVGDKVKAKVQEHPELERALATAGVGGIRRHGIKCLHAHYADYLATGDNPVGEIVHKELERRHLLPESSCAICREGERASRIAVAKVGTNSVRMLVVERILADGQAGFALAVQDDVSRITRIGRGVHKAGRLSAEGIQATIAVLQEFQQRAKAAGADIVRLVGTSALRDAAGTCGEQSASGFATQVRETMGLELEIISGEKEAELSYRGAVFGCLGIDPLAQVHGEGLPGEDSEVIVMDIGGGSTEVMGRDAYSFAIGAVRLSEIWAASGGQLVGDTEDWEALLSLVRSLVKQEAMAADSSLAKAIGNSFGGNQWQDKQDGGKAGSGARVRAFHTAVGVGGTFTALATVKKGLSEYTREAVHGTRLAREEIVQLGRSLFALEVEKRKEIAGLQPGREDILPFGAAIAAAFMGALRLESIIVSVDDLLLGAALEWYAARHGRM